MHLWAFVSHTCFCAMFSLLSHSIAHRLYRCSWDNPEVPGLFSPIMQPVPIAEDPCVVQQVQKVRSSPRISFYSPVTPESGAESYTTAKTHMSMSTHSPTMSPNSRKRTKLLPRNISPHLSLKMVGPVIVEGISLKLFHFLFICVPNNLYRCLLMRRLNPRASGRLS